MSMTPHVCRCATCFREIKGAVAQLGERLSGRQEVRGSSPRSSTILDEDERADSEAWQRASAEAFWRVEKELEEGAQVSDEMAEESHWNEDGLTGLALELADMVSDMVWGGERGWERATMEQFKHLKREARKRMKI